MNRRTFRQGLSLLCLLTVALLAAQAQPVALTYSPADGAVFDVVEKATRVTSVTGEASVTDERKRESRVTVAAAAAPGPNEVAPVPAPPPFSNTVAIVSQSVTRNGQAVTSPLHWALSGLALTYDLAADGSLLGISGYEGLGEAMAQRLPDKLAATLLKLVSSDSLLQQDRASYEEVHGPFVGASLTPAVNQVSAAVHALPSEGTVVVYAVTTIEALADSAIQITRTFNSDAAALAAKFDGLEEATISAARGTLTSMLPATYASASVSGDEAVIVATSGALVESRTFEWRSEWTPTVSEGETPRVHVVEERKEFAATDVTPPADPMMAAQP